MCYSAIIKRDLKDLEADLDAAPLLARFDSYDSASKRDPKKFPALEERIFPGHYAPVTHGDSGPRQIEPMRYGAYPPTGLPHAQKYTAFNARRDNLTSPFWREAFQQHHGIVILRRFYEWVAVADLLAAGVISLDAVKKEFARQAAERREKIAASGKPYKPTPTERKDPRDRQIIIEFRPEDGQDLLVPAIFSTNPEGRADAVDRFGFAIITDDPPLEISAAGHDRCPVILTANALDDWLNPSEKSAKELTEVLMSRRRAVFAHALPLAA